MSLSRRLVLSAGPLAMLSTRQALAASNNSQAQPATKGPVSIGALLPLSGAGSLSGDECLRGIELAVTDVNAAGGVAGRRIALSTNDALGQNDAEPSAKSLIDDSHAGILLGTGLSDLSYPGSAAAELAQIPYIELNAPADGITGRGFKFLLRTCATSTMIAAVAIAAISARHKGAKIGLLFNTGATGGAIAQAALNQWQAQKITPLLAAGYPQDAADLHEPVSRLRRAGAEVLLHAAEEDDVLQMFQAMQDIGWAPAAIFGCGNGYGLRETAFALGAAFDGTYLVASPFYPPRATYISNAYQDRFGMAPRSADSLSAYVGAKLVFDILNGAGGDTAKLLDALRKTNIAPGTLANGWGAQFDKAGQNTRSFVSLQQWRGQSLVDLS